MTPRSGMKGSGARLFSTELQKFGLEQGLSRMNAESPTENGVHIYLLHILEVFNESDD